MINKNKIEYSDILKVKRNILAFYNECVQYKCIYDDTDIYENFPYWNFINIDKKMYDDSENDLIENGSLLIIFSMCSSEIGNISKFMNFDKKLVSNIIHESMNSKSNDEDEKLKSIVLKWLDILIENKIKDDMYNALQLDSEYLFEKYIKSYYFKVYEELIR